jgi:hypothetical protein
LRILSTSSSFCLRTSATIRRGRSYKGARNRSSTVGPESCWSLQTHLSAFVIRMDARGNLLGCEFTCSSATSRSSMGEFLSAAESRGSAGLGERFDTSGGEHNSNELRTHRPAPRMLEFPFASLDAPGDRSEALLPGLAYANIARGPIYSAR